MARPSLRCWLSAFSIIHPMNFANRIAAILCCALAYLSPAHAASVVPLYLDEMIDTSAVAFEATCTGNRAERDAETNLVVTYTTFEVREVLKGFAPTTHVIKQIGGALPEESVQYRVDGIPTFIPGEDYVVFLAGVSSAGFSSPIGLAQGKFSVKDANGRRHAGNGRDFKDMAARILARMPASARTRLEQVPGPVRDMDLDDFKQTVRNHVEASR